MNLGVTELVLVLAVALLLFGPSRLPGLGKAIGETIRGFKKGMTEGASEEKPVTEISHQATPDLKTQTQKSQTKENSHS